MRSAGETDPIPDPAHGAPALARERDRLRQIVDGLAELAALGLPGDMLMERIVARVREMTDATGAVVELVDGDELEYVAATGTIARHVGLRLARGASLSGLCVAFRALQYSDDTETDRRVDREACRRVGARSMLVVPLLHRDEAVGVIKVIADRPAAFDEVDEYAVRLCAGLLAGIIARHLVAEEGRRLLVARSHALQRATAVLDAAPVAMLVHDLEGRVESWNAAAERLLGWRAQDVVGRPLPIVPAARRDAFVAAGRAAAARRGAPEPDHVAHRDGSALAVRLGAAAVEDERGQVTALVRSIEPIADAGAARERSHLRHVLDAAGLAHATLDGTGRVCAWSGAATRLLGWTAEEARGRLLAELVLPAQARGLRQYALTRHVAARRDGVVEHAIPVDARHRDGHTLALRVSLVLGWPDGDPRFDVVAHAADAPA